MDRHHFADSIDGPDYFLGTSELCAAFWTGFLDVVGDLLREVDCDAGVGAYDFGVDSVAAGYCCGGGAGETRDARYEDVC